MQIQEASISKFTFDQLKKLQKYAKRSNKKLFKEGDRLTKENLTEFLEHYKKMDVKAKKQEIMAKIQQQLKDTIYKLDYQKYLQDHKLNQRQVDLAQIIELEVILKRIKNMQFKWSTFSGQKDAAAHPHQFNGR